MRCLDHPHFSIMLNGASKSFFSSSQGIRQGDPLSLFLFIMVANAFSALMSKALSNSLIDRFRIRRDGVWISHLQFADDTICFCFINDLVEQVTHLKYILKIYEMILSLKVNLSKSSLAGIRVEVGDVCRYAHLLGCRVEQWPLKYLGMLLRGGKKSGVFWDLDVERVNKKLSSCKKSYISLGGKITLIKSTLANIPVYYMSLFKMPAKVVKVL